MIINVLQDLGLAKNEARIYETLLREGESGVATISSKAAINRRNVYDSLNRLIEKGLIFEIRAIAENRYQAVEPKKLTEILDEKLEDLYTVMPEMEKLYNKTPHQDEVFIYRGIEGWKNYLRDMLRIGKDNYTIGGTGAWLHPKMSSFMGRFLKEAEKQQITFHILFNHEVQEQSTTLTYLKNSEYKFLPKGYSTNTAIDIFGDHVVTLSGLTLGGFDENMTSTIIVNPNIAESYRTWFKLMWDNLPDTH
jgi:sugar-specific transcriptional regulator TrmB